MAKSQPSDGIEFSFSETLQEIRHLRALASRFLEAESGIVMNTWVEQLEGFQSSAKTDFVWEIRDDQPIRTKIPVGELSPAKWCGRRIVCEVSAQWEIRADKGTSKHPNRPRMFTLVRNKLGTTRVRMVEDRSVAAEFHFDVVSGSEPGPPFHLQVNWDLNGKPGTAKLDIPRLPGFVVTPMDALALMLGEVFQEIWTQDAAGEAANGLRRLQWNRVSNVLEWYSSQIRSGSALPWLAFSNRPSSRLFTSEGPR